VPIRLLPLFLDFPFSVAFPTAAAAAAAENVARILQKKKIESITVARCYCTFFWPKLKFLCRSFAIVVALQLSEEAH